VKRIEGRSSHILGQEFPEYLSFYAMNLFILRSNNWENVSKETIEKYIEAQKGEIMLVRKIIKAKIMDEANNRKLEALEKEYTNFQNLATP